MLGAVGGVIREAIALGAYAAGLGLTRWGARRSTVAGMIEAERALPDPATMPEDEPDDRDDGTAGAMSPGASVELSEEARRMIADGASGGVRRPAVSRPEPLAGSAAARARRR